jgi:ribosomal protein L21E
MYKVGDRVVVKNKDSVIKTFVHYTKGLPNWTQAKGYQAMFVEDMFSFCGQSGVVYEVKNSNEEVKIKFHDDLYPTIWTWHNDWITPHKVDNRTI